MSGGIGGPQIIPPGGFPRPPKPPKPNEENYWDVHYSRNSITLNFHACCNCKELLDRVYGDMKTFKHWGNNSVASLNVSGDTGSFYPGLGMAVLGLGALNDPNWTVRFSFDDQSRCVSARTQDNHPLVGVRKWCASLKTSGATCAITITTEAYERPRNLVNLVAGNGIPLLGINGFGYQDQVRIWEHYFGNIANAFQGDSFFDSSKRGTPIQFDTNSGNNPFLK